MATDRSANKYKTPFRGPYEIVQTWTNGTVTLRTIVVTMKKYIYNVKPYKDKDVE